MSNFIPNCIIDSDDYYSLNKQQKLNFEAKLKYCAEILGNITEFINTPSITFESILDDIELDAYSIISSGNPKQDVSSYLIHSSWSIYCDNQKMVDAIPPVVNEFFSHPLPCLNSSYTNFIDWLSMWANAMAETISTFKKSESFDAAIANYIILDALIALILTFSAIRRIACNYDRTTDES